ncbi:hypothetical protein [Natronobiforma cellulositropha]|uniref:hypothetical protein n=1 Tax=Natronobiforma cellulositropha TaxID=1679076 RepID=UPI0021D6047A|nr:hypothetical protein [Natronobiforma cellulositropha]
MRRREFATLSIATVSAGLAGCLGSGDEQDRPEADESQPIWLDEDGHIDVADVDWGVEEADPEDPTNFRFWLNSEQLEPEMNLRFDYTHGYEPDLFETVPEFVEVTEESVEGTLVQHANVIHLGSFDAEDILDSLADDADYEETGERGAFTIVDERIAIGQHAIILGDSADGLEIPLEVYEGDRDPLEIADPAFARVFEELPEDHSISGQYGLPPGVDLDVDGQYVLGLSNDPDDLPDGPDDRIETNWVFLFPDESDLTEEALSELKTIAHSVSHAEIDGRVARVEGEWGLV